MSTPFSTRDDKSMQRIFYVYHIIHKESGRKYIGKGRGNRINKYFTATLSGIKGQRHIYSAIKKYGIDAFNAEKIVQNLTEQQALIVQKDQICKHKYVYGDDFLFNIKQGGSGVASGINNHMYGKSSWSKGKTFSQQHRLNISRSKKLRPMSKQKLKNMLIKRSITVSKMKNDGTYVPPRQKGFTTSQQVKNKLSYANSHKIPQFAIDDIDGTNKKVVPHRYDGGDKTILVSKWQYYCTKLARQESGRRDRNKRYLRKKALKQRGE